MNSAAAIFLATSTTPATPQWNLGVALVMISCNLFVFFIGKWAIKNSGKGPALPGAPDSGLLKNFGIPELLATTSLGHILGAGMILGLSNAGLL